MKDRYRGIPDFDEGRRYVLVAREKHGTRYFDASTREALLKSALALLTERFKSKWYYYKPEEPKAPYDLPSEDAVKAMPEGQIKKLAAKMLADYRAELRNYEDDSDTYKAIVAAVKEKDGEKAWDCLRAREGGEYEHVKVEELETG